MWTRFQLFGIQNKWDGVWSKSSFLDFEAHRNSTMFYCVFMFLLCKEFVEVFVGTWILVFCRWIELWFGCDVLVRYFYVMWCEYGDSDSYRCQTWSAWHLLSLVISLYLIIWNRHFKKIKIKKTSGEFFWRIDLWEILYLIFCMVIFKQLILHNSSYGHPWTISKKIISFSSLIVLFLFLVH